MKSTGRVLNKCNVPNKNATTKVVPNQNGAIDFILPLTIGLFFDLLKRFFHQ